MEWTTACLDWETRLLKGEPLIALPPLFPDEATSALAVFNELRLADLPGAPTMGESVRQWMTDFVSAVFGSYDPETGRRLISEFFLLIGKKNIKSTGASGVMMTAIVRNWRESAEFLILAPTIEVANNSFFPARDMVRKDEELSDLMHVQDHYRTITNRKTGTTLKVIAAENESVGGKKGTGVLIDEAWLFGKQPNAENMIREATGGLASRPEGFVIWLSTQSDQAPAGIFKQKLQYARGVRDGKIKDNTFLPVLYEFPREMVKDGKIPERKFWSIPNPNLGASVDPAFLDREFKKAEDAGKESMLGFLAKHLNIEIGLALLSNSWPGAVFWERQGRPGLTLDEVLERSEVVVAGVDGGGLDDLLGFAAIGRDAKTKEWLLWSHAWAHPSVLERHKQEAARFLDFAADGDLTLVERIGMDIEELVAILSTINDSGLLDKIGLDPQSIGAILDALADDKLDMINEGGKEVSRVIGISQGWKLTGAIKTAERKLAEGTLIHGSRPMMAWCAGNARVEPKGNAVLITKQASGFAKIDPLMALFDAVSLMALNPVARGKGFNDWLAHPIAA